MKQENILTTAQEATSSSRQKAYGHPADNFLFIAELWNTYLNSRVQVGAPDSGVNITPEDVGMLFILTKVARQGHKHSTDNLVDIAGYARTVQMVKEAEA